MLAQRVATALVLVALLVPALAAKSIWPFAALSLVLMSLAGWEWARLNGAGNGAGAVAFGVGLGICCSAALAAGWGERAPPLTWYIATAVWVFAGGWALRGGVAAWPKVAPPIRLGIGFVVLWTAWLAIANAKGIGLNFILSILFVVWSADVFAYFGGRALGRRKLAPSISPGKSWEGVWSGVLGALLVSAVWLWWVDRAGFVDGPSLQGRIGAMHGIVVVVLAIVVLVAMSIVGDLFESLVKRSAGAKDSSRLLPGHGGILDRIDALLPAFPIALAMVAT